MSNGSIERQGIYKLSLLLEQSGVVDTSNIPTGDKGISWDGYLDVFNDENHTVDNLRGKIHVQIKSKSIDKDISSFPIRKNDLINYKKENKVLYFYVVFIGEEKTVKFYYLPLQLWDIQTALNEFKDENSKNFSFKELPNNPLDIKNILHNFVDIGDRQKMLIPGVMSYEDLVKKNGRVPVTFNVKTKSSKITDVIKAIEEEQPYIWYESKDTNIKFVVDRFKGQKIKYVKPKLRTISIGDVVYFKDLTSVFDNAKEEIKCNDSLVITVDESKITVNYSLKGSYKEKYEVASFLYHLVQEKSFKLNDSIVSLPSEVIDDLSNKINGTYLFLEKYKKLSEELGIRKEPNFDAATESDYKLFEYLYNCLVLNKPCPLLEPRNGLAHLSIFGLELLLFVTSNDVESMLFNWTKLELYMQTGSDSSERFDVSPYFTLSDLKENKFLLIDNIRLDLLSKELFSGHINEPVLYHISNIILNLVNVFDLRNDKDALNVALEIANKLIGMRPKNIVFQINYYQTLLRIRPLEEQERATIEELILAFPEDHDICFSLYTLLGKKDSASKELALCDPKIIDDIKKWPIYHLFELI